MATSHCSCQYMSVDCSGFEYYSEKSNKQHGFSQNKQRTLNDQTLAVSHSAVNRQPPTWSAGRAHLNEFNVQLLGRQTIGRIGSCTCTSMSDTPQQDTTTCESGGASSLLCLARGAAASCFKTNLTQRFES